MKRLLVAVKRKKLTIYIILIAWIALVLTFSSLHARTSTHHSEGENRLYWVNVGGDSPRAAKRSFVEADNDTFTSCGEEGYLDASAYPLIDAQLMFCGGLDGGSRLSGLLSLTYAEPCSANLPVCQLYVKLDKMKSILLQNVSDSKPLSIVEAKEALIFSKDGPNHTLTKLTREDPSFHNEIFHFLPSALSAKKVVLFFLRLVAKQCIRQSQCDHLYKWSLDLLQAYSKHNIGKRHYDNEDDSYQDVTLLIELLTNILSKDLIDFNESDTELQAEVIIRPSAEETSAADVVLYGLNMILPLVSSQLLLYPSFCFQYYKLVTFLCEIYPEKIEKLPQSMLQCFIFSLQVGLSSYGSENCKLCLEAVEGLATQCLKTKDTPSPLHGPTTSFVRLVFDTLIVHAADMDLLRTAADTFYSLLCFQPQHTMQVFHQIVASQPDESYKERLSEAFSHLVPDLEKVDSSRAQRSAFIRTLETVIFNIRGILCVK